LRFEKEQSQVRLCLKTHRAARRSGFWLRARSDDEQYWSGNTARRSADARGQKPQASPARGFQTEPSYVQIRASSVERPASSETRHGSNSCFIRRSKFNVKCSKFVFLIVLPLFVTFTGCASTVVNDPLTPIVAKIDDPLSAELEFWHGLTTRPVVCNDDAFHGLLLFLDEKDPNTDYAGRVAALKSRKLIPADFNRAGNVAVYRGTIAYALLQSLHIHGGWVLTAFGPSPRYALRELMDLNLFPRSSPEQTFSGSEFVGIIGRAEDYHVGESAFIPAQTVRPLTPGD
jgi:hypothetical protein